MAWEGDETGQAALRLMRAHGDRVMATIQERIASHVARGDWTGVEGWCRIRIRVTRLLLARERAVGGGGWQPVFATPAAPPPRPGWTGLHERLARPDPSAA